MEELILLYEDTLLIQNGKKFKGIKNIKVTVSRESRVLARI